MKLIVHEIEGSALEQEIIPERNTIVVAVRPHIYRHNFASGNLILEIIDDEDNVIAESDPVAIAEIEELNYFHGYVTFNIKAYLARGQTYKLRLSADGGYSFSESAYCGWVNGFDLAKYPVSETPDSHFNFPLDYEVWERTPK